MMDGSLGEAMGRIPSEKRKVRVKKESQDVYCKDGGWLGWVGGGVGAGGSGFDGEDFW